MRETRPYGFVRGVLGDWHPYRDTGGFESWKSTSQNSSLVHCWPFGRRSPRLDEAPASAMDDPEKHSEVAKSGQGLVAEPPRNAPNEISLPKASRSMFAPKSKNAGFS